MADPTLASALRLAARTWALLAVLAVLGATIGGVAFGAGAAWSAVVGVALAAVLFGVSVLLLVLTIWRSSDANLGLLIGGLGIRLASYLVILDATATTAWLHRETLAVSVAVALAVTMVAEFVWLARSPQLFNVDPEAGRPAVASTATRS
jgi:hypothetical protein